MTDYALEVSESEIRRYLHMAGRAAEAEAGLWALAGIVEGAAVADIGCGPAAVSVAMARVVGPTGRVVGVEREESALAAARQLVAGAGADNVQLQSGAATRTGLEAGSFDVVVMRHVLAHNGSSEGEIVEHLATLVRPGGCVYLVDVEATGIRVLDGVPEMTELSEAYRELHRRRGNDLMTGLRLGKLLTAAGLELVTHQGRYEIVVPPPGMRPPSWAARDAMVAEGVCTAQDVARWGAAFEESDASPVRPTMFLPTFVGIGRRTA